MSKKLVPYFSITGHTKKIAKMLAEAVEGDLYEIKAKNSYTLADLDWSNSKSRTSIEQKINQLVRPALMKDDLEINQYSIVFVGFPIWWWKAPKIINTFLENYDFENKTVIPFATSGGSKIDDTLTDLKKSISLQTTMLNGKTLNGTKTVENLQTWVKSLKLD